MDLQLEEEDNWELPVDSLNFLTSKSCDRKPTSVSKGHSGVPTDGVRG